MSHSTPPHYAIIGGGIAGLTLALALTHRNIPYTIYEQAHEFGEIGAGVAFGPNSVRAMELCAPAVINGFWKVRTGNGWERKSKVYFEWMDGYHGLTKRQVEKRVGSKEEQEDEKLLFLLDNTVGANSVHRAAFLDQLVLALPKNAARFHKRLEKLEPRAEDGKITMTFADGTSDVADAVIGCDGIKSRVRQLIFGAENPMSHPHYTHKYAFRGLIPIDRAIKALGEDTAVNAKMHTGPDGHILTFPVAANKMMNVVAFRTNPDPWPASISEVSKLTLPSQKSTALKEFQGWGPKVQGILEMLEDKLDCWAIFDTLDNPLSHYNHGKILLCGDAAHATSPHMGSGAGLCIEDSAVLAELLASSKLQDDQAAQCVEEAFAVFDWSRRQRTQWLVESSRRVGDLFEWRAEGVGSDAKKIEEELWWRHHKIWDGDARVYAGEAVTELERRLRMQRNGH